MQKYFERVYQSIRHFWTLTHIIPNKAYKMRMAFSSSLLMNDGCLISAYGARRLRKLKIKEFMVTLIFDVNRENIDGMHQL